MATYEVGHKINVEHMGDLCTELVSLGTDYNPGPPEIALAALQSKLAQAEASMKFTGDALNAYIAKVNERQAQFDSMRLLATRIINNFIACSPGPAAIKNARAYNRKLRGERADKSVLETDTVEPVGVIPSDAPALDTVEDADERRLISVAQLSFTSKAYHFDGLATLVTSNSKYISNEPELSAAGVIATRNLLFQINKDEAALASNLFKNRNLRNILLYAEGKGVYHLSIAVKNYVRSALGKDDARYKRIAKIKFTDLSRKK